MSEDFSIMRIGDHFEIQSSTIPLITAEVQFNNPHPRLRNLKVLEKSRSAELTKIKNEALEYLRNFAIMGE